MKSWYRKLPEKRGSSGFSLLEVMVAIAVLSIAIAMIIQLYSMNLRSTQKAEQYTHAVILARSVMDESLSTETFEETTESDTFDDRFEVTKTIAVIGSGDDELFKTYEITVSVNWQGGSFVLQARKSIPESDPGK